MPTALSAGPWPALGDQPDLSFAHVRESERTKHVHRLHPYLGKFIPQLAEFFLRRYFLPGSTVIDPFAGSGTTLVEANVLGIHSVGVELCEWNCVITRVKTGRFDRDRLASEIRDALQHVATLPPDGEAAAPTAQLRRRPATPRPSESRSGLDSPATKVASARPEVARSGSAVDQPRPIAGAGPHSPYLSEWYSPRALRELLAFRDRIPIYKHQDVLRVILSRSARSARLVPHYDLARPQRPVRTDYYCIKHRRTCAPVDEALKFMRRYAADTLRRLGEFAALRTNATMTILHADARQVTYDRPLAGILTSPPYVGLIDYHDQHRYAYELFPELHWLPEQEIGRLGDGRSRSIRDRYCADVAATLSRVPLRSGAPVILVANDAFGLYPEIATRAGLEIERVFHRPVLKRTERDSAQYSESVFLMRRA
ncbi:MAG: hypothetical protein HY329_17730 [Chloroflexi bacterium]|nr:hypothetical protein [Chloroflexota bacterium]